MLKYCSDCGDMFESPKHPGRQSGRCMRCRSQGAHISTVPAGSKDAPPFDGPVCACGHLALVHDGGVGVCFNATCSCQRSTRIDTRWASAARTREASTEHLAP